MTVGEARFVSAEIPSEAGDPAVYFRREFTAGDGLQRATLRVTALGIVEPYLNGVRVGDEVLAPGWTSYRHHLNLSGYDVTDLVRTGANAVGAIVADGWAVGRMGFEHRRHHASDRPALYLELELEYADHVETVGTGTGFRVGTGAVRSAGIYEGEEYDARLEPIGWSEPEFDDEEWRSAQPFEWDLGTLREPAGPPICRIEEVAPVAITTTPSGRTLVDFGQNLTGWVRITVNGDAGQTVTLRHAEVLTPDGEPEFETNRTAQATDRYTLRGGGPETWEPRFTFHGFRYVEVEGWPGAVDSAAMRAIVVHSDMDRTGWFETSDELVTRLHENIVWSMRGNFVGLPTDCPQRDERLGWTGDLNAFAPTATFLYDVRGVLGSWLIDLAAEHAEKGYVPWVVPDVMSTPSSPTALWSDAAVRLPWELYQEYGDADILRRSYASMTAFVRQVAGLLDENGLWGTGFQFGDWLDPDAPAENASGGKTDKHLVATAFFAVVSREMAAAARILGHDDDAGEFDALAVRVRAAFRHEYVAPSGRMVSESATAYALAIVFDLLTEAEEQRAGDRLAALVAAAGYRISTGFAGTPHVAHALTRTGHFEEAYLMLLQRECPSFLYPVTMGATTIWERWDSIRPDGTLNSTGMTSLNHYALGSVGDWLHRVVGGLERSAPGWARIRVAPKPGGGLLHARVAHETVLGRAEVSWRIDGAEIEVDVTVPEGARALVELPLHPEDAVEEVGGGRHSWRYAVPEGYGVRPAFDLDTPLAELAADAAVWHRVQGVFAQHLPGIPIDGSAPEAAAISLDQLVGLVPGAPPELADALRSALEETP
ncbi:MAG: alpha-L-rhamnosidase [Microbacteriaceae bacterium]|nr:MAG: alpha-L-rhamnosidase [Microbacteriaceae bacterium]